jgi:hypothetical protein
LGKANAAVVDAEDTADLTRIFAETRFNGDGIVHASAAREEPVKRLIEDIMDCLGSRMDRSGAPVISQDMVDRFFGAAQDYSDWWTKAEADAANILPLGDATPAAAATFEAVKPKVDDYFTRCRLAGFDARAADPLNPPLATYERLSSQSLSARAGDLAALPLARIEAGRPLPLTEGLNPAWADAVAELREQVVRPLLGDRSAMELAEWEVLSAKFAAHEAWIAAKQGLAVEKLGLERVRALLAGDGKAAVTALIAQDQALEPEADAIASVDRLVRYHRDLFTLLNNFVSFRDFYRQETKAIFQAGVLYLDSRSCESCACALKISPSTALWPISAAPISPIASVAAGAAPRR